MEIITIEKEAYKSLISKIEEVHQEIVKLKDPGGQIARQWCSTKEASQILKCSARTLYTYKIKGFLSPTNVNNKDYYDINDLRDLLKNGPGRNPVINKLNI